MLQQVASLWAMKGIHRQFCPYSWHKKIADIIHMTFVNAYPWMKIIIIWFKFFWFFSKGTNWQWFCIDSGHFLNQQWPYSLTFCDGGATVLCDENSRAVSLDQSGTKVHAMYVSILAENWETWVKPYNVLFRHFGFTSWHPFIHWLDVIY